MAAGSRGLTLTPSITNSPMTCSTSLAPYCTCMYSCSPVQTISLTEGRATSGINGVIQCEGISVFLDGAGVAVPARTAAHFSAAPYLYMRRGSGAPLLCSQVPSRYLIARGYFWLVPCQPSVMRNVLHPPSHTQCCRIAATLIACPGAFSAGSTP